jgi:multiple sugar transport system permease protein
LTYAALQTLPRDVGEAAHIDGAKVWQRFFHIKLPLLAPSLAAIFLLKLILSFKIFDLIYVLTAGGPGVDTNLATFKIWPRFGKQHCNPRESRCCWQFSCYFCCRFSISLPSA